MDDDPGTLYDLAFSFAGEHRDYVEQTKAECERLGRKHSPAVGSCCGA